MGKEKLEFSTIVNDAGIRVFEVSSPQGPLVKCEIHWPRTRQRKRQLHTVGLARNLTKTMILETVLPPLVDRIRARYGKPKGRLLSKMIEEFLERHGSTVKPETKQWYREGLKKVSRVIGDVPISAITPDVLERYKSDNANTPGATNNSLHVLHTLFEKAMLWGYVEKNPVRRVPFLKANPSRARMFLDDEREKLIKSAKVDPSPFIYRFVLWQLNTGMRPKETVRIKEGDVDLKHGRVRLGVTKSNRPRYVPLSKTAQDIAWALWHGDGGFLFRGANGQPLTVDTVQRVFLRVARRAGVNVRLYDCRHDALSRIAAGGASLPTLQAISGHRTLSMVNRYLHLSPHHFEPAMEAVERAEVKGLCDDVVTTPPEDATPSVPQVVESENEPVEAGEGVRLYGKSESDMEAESTSASLTLRKRQAAFGFRDRAA